jgi:hypothetical protein
MNGLNVKGLATFRAYTLRKAFSFQIGGYLRRRAAASSSSCSVALKPRQPSVTETP